MKTAYLPSNWFSNSQLSTRWDCWVFCFLLLVVNAPVLGGMVPESMVFLPGAFIAGDWWRLFTHPFVHLSWYHFLLDGTAFVLLYLSLREPSCLRRLLFVAAGGAGSLAFAWTLTGLREGLCGLSGVAHGLMAISAMEILAGSSAGTPERRFGCASLALALAKAVYEALTGRMFLEFLHFGLLGSPVAVSHAGGIFGGLLAWFVLSHSSAPQLSDHVLACHGFPRRSQSSVR